MLREPYPVVDLLGQISGSNAGSKLLVEFVGQIAGRIHGSNSLVELLDQIGRSNSWIKFLGQICWSNAANPWPAAGEPRRMHGRAYGQPENGLGRARKRQRKTPRVAAWGLVGWR